MKQGGVTSPVNMFMTLAAWENAFSNPRSQFFALPTWKSTSRVICWFPSTLRRKIFSLTNFFISVWIVLGILVFCISDAGYWADVCGCHTVWRKVDSFSNFDFLLVQKVWQSSRGARARGSPCHGSLSHTFLPYRRSMRSCPLPHHGDFVFRSLDHWGLWHRWNFKQAQRSLWDWVPRPTTCVVIGQSRCCFVRLRFSLAVLPKSRAYCKAVETSLLWTDGQLNAGFQHPMSCNWEDW